MKTRMDQAQFQHDCREQHFTAQTQDLLARLGCKNEPVLNHPIRV